MIPQEARGRIPRDRSAFKSFKENVRIEDVAADYGEFRLQGAGRLLGRCVSPSHPDRTPSMTIFTDEQRFKCFGIGCGAHGDALDLAMLAEGCELWEAMIILSQRYGVDLPKRPRSWFARQKRQKPMRDAIEDARLEVMMRRLWRWIFEPILADIEDADERERIGDELWAKVLPRAKQLVEERGGKS